MSSCERKLVEVTVCTSDFVHDGARISGEDVLYPGTQVSEEESTRRAASVGCSSYCAKRAQLESSCVVPCYQARPKGSRCRRERRPEQTGDIRGL